jgi:putative restriction endonuclease
LIFDWGRGGRRSAGEEGETEGQNDDIQNGLALCKNAHWSFDEGLWSVLDDGRVALAPHRFTENGPDGLRLQPYSGRFLHFATGVTLRPNSEFFARHRAFHRVR